MSNNLCSNNIHSILLISGKKNRPQITLIIRIFFRHELYESPLILIRVNWCNWWQPFCEAVIIHLISGLFFRHELHEFPLILIRANWCNSCQTIYAVIIIYSILLISGKKNRPQITLIIRIFFRHEFTISANKIREFVAENVPQQ